MPEMIYTLGSWQWWMWVLAMLIGVSSLIVTVRTVLRDDAPRRALIRWFVFWTLAPVLWCTLEYHSLFSSLPPSETTGAAFEHFKYGQEVATKFWIAMVALVGLRLLHDRRVEKWCDHPAVEKGAPNKAMDSDEE